MKQEQTYQGNQGLTGNTHPSHDWHPDDDVIACDRCAVRTYSPAAKEPCVGYKPAISIGVPTIYLDEKIGKLNRMYDDLEAQGKAGMDQQLTLRLIDDLARVIRQEAQKWAAVLKGGTK